jgi:hypothetical protein
MSALGWRAQVMQRIEYKDYLDKVYGCWIGKCVGWLLHVPTYSLMH